MWEGEGDPVEGGDVWVECRAVIRGVQKPALRGTTEDQHQANNVVATIWKISLETHNILPNYKTNLIGELFSE